MSLHISLSSSRARTRVQSLLGRDLAWLCPWGWRRDAACASVSAEEWQQIQTRGIPGVKCCRQCEPAARSAARDTAEQLTLL